MAKKDKTDEVDVTVEEVTPQPITKVFVRPPRTKVYTFEQWAKIKNKHDRHMGGMRAFLGDLAANKYPLEKWDEMMKAY